MLLPVWSDLLGNSVALKTSYFSLWNRRYFVQGISDAFGKNIHLRILTSFQFWNDQKPWNETCDVEKENTYPNQLDVCPPAPLVGFLLINFRCWKFLLLSFGVLGWSHLVPWVQVWLSLCLCFVGRFLVIPRESNEKIIQHSKYGWIGWMNIRILYVY